MSIIFYSSIIFIFYAYIGYPLLLGLCTTWRKRPIKKGKITPTVSCIIPVYNEEKRIKAKIENTLQQDYPRSLFEILVVSDCSTDATDEIVQSYQADGVRLLKASIWQGKESAQKLAIDVASGEILVFSDVATMLTPDGIANVVQNFCDPTVGCVSSVDKLLNPNGQGSGEGIYVQYEMLLRSLETQVGSLVGLSGSLFAARKEICKSWAVNLPSDFYTLLNAVKMGFRGVSDPDTIGYYRTIRDETKEFDRKVRTVLRGIKVFMSSFVYVDPLRHAFFFWQLLSHKLCRWLVPFAMIVAFFSNIFIIHESFFYGCIFVMQVAFYVLAIKVLFSRLATKNYVFKLPAFFVLVNVSILYAWWLYVRGESIVKWTPSER